MTTNKQYQQGNTFNPQAVGNRACTNTSSCSSNLPIYKEEVKNGIKLVGIGQIVSGIVIFLSGLTCLILSHVYNSLWKDKYPFANFKLSDPDHWRAPGTYTGIAVMAAGICAILSVSKNRFMWVRSAMISHYVVIGMIWMVVAGSIQSLVELFRDNNCQKINSTFESTVCVMRFVSMALNFLMLLLTVVVIAITGCNLYKIRCSVIQAARTQQEQRNTVAMAPTNGLLTAQPYAPPAYQTNYGLQGEDKPSTPPPAYAYGVEKQGA